MRATASIAQPGVSQVKALAVSVYAAISKVTVRTATSVIVTIIRSGRCLRDVVQRGASVGAIESCQRNCIGPPGLVEQTQLMAGSYDAPQSMFRASGPCPRREFVYT